MYIRQKKQNENDVTVVIKTDMQDLTQHPAILDNPNKFEIVDEEIPTENVNFLIYNPAPVENVQEQIQDLMAKLQELQNRLNT